MASSDAASWHPRIGLALGGGVARGFTHIGVLKALIAHGVVPDIVVGTSIGAVVGASYLVGKLDVMEEWACSLNRFRALSYLDFHMRTAGLINGERLTSKLREHMGDITIQELDRPFVAVAADLTTGHEVWLRNGSLVDALRASFSLPGIFAPVMHDHQWLIDGALVNPVPVSPCVAMGAQMTIAVNLSSDIIGMARKPGSPVPTVAGFDLLEQDHETAEVARKTPFLQRFFHRDPDQPSLFGVMFTSLNILQDRIGRSRLAGDPPDVEIGPRVGHIGLAEFDRAEEMIEEGMAAVERKMPQIRDALTVMATAHPR